MKHNQTMVGWIVEQSRRGKGLCQRELAKKVGVTERTICNAESGESTPRRDTLVWIEQALDLPANLLTNARELDVGIATSAAPARWQPVLDDWQWRVLRFMGGDLTAEEWAARWCCRPLEIRKAMQELRARFPEEALCA